MSSLLFVLLMLPGIQGKADAAGLVAPPGKCQNVSGFGNKKKAKRSMLCFTNFARTKSGLKRYRMNSKLTWSSTRKVRDIMRCDDFSHEACGRQFSYWIKRSRYPGCAWGENIAWGTGNLGTSRGIFIAWMKSPGHRAAILSSSYEAIGIGLKAGKLDGYSRARVWVQNFGASC